MLSNKLAKCRSMPSLMRTKLRSIQELDREIYKLLRDVGLAGGIDARGCCRALMGTGLVPSNLHRD